MVWGGTTGLLRFSDYTRDYGMWIFGNVPIFRSTIQYYLVRIYFDFTAVSNGNSTVVHNRGLEPV
jgi:hypothetical protein